MTCVSDIHKSLELRSFLGLVLLPNHQVEPGHHRLVIAFAGLSSAVEARKQLQRLGRVQNPIAPARHALGLEIILVGALDVLVGW